LKDPRRSVACPAFDDNRIVQVVHACGQVAQHAEGAAGRPSEFGMGEERRPAGVVSVSGAKGAIT
jgi:hypothetical protein